MKNRTLWIVLLCAVLVTGLIVLIAVNNQNDPINEQPAQDEVQAGIEKEPANEPETENAPAETAVTEAAATEEPSPVGAPTESEEPKQEETPAPEETQEAGEDIEIVEGEDGTVVITIPEGMDVGEL